MQNHVSPAKRFEAKVISYASYHRDWRNVVIHIIGVPVIVFSVLLFMCWFRFLHSDALGYDLSMAELLYFGFFIWYYRLDKGAALFQLPISMALLYFAKPISALPFWESFSYFAATFVGGWAALFFGHVFEGRRPALVDNVLEIFVAPLFVAVELLFLVGYRKDLQDKLKALPKNNNKTAA